MVPLRESSLCSGYFLYLRVPVRYHLQEHLLRRLFGMIMIIVESPKRLRSESNSNSSGSKKSLPIMEPIKKPPLLICSICRGRLIVAKYSGTCRKINNNGVPQHKKRWE